VDGVPVEISAEAVWQLDADGNRITMTGEQLRRLRSSSGRPEADPLDLLVHVAWNAPLRTRRERA
jgi:hypothetical protein